MDVWQGFQFFKKNWGKVVDNLCMLWYYIHVARIKLQIKEVTKMYVTCEELGKSLEISVRFFKEGNWSVDESNDLLSDATTYDGANISAADFENLKMFLESEESTLQRGGRSDDWLSNMTLEELGFEGINIDIEEGELD